MKLDSQYKPELVASKDKLRVGLQNISFERDENGKGIAVAVDGKMLVVCPCEIDASEEIGLVAPDAIKQARKAGKSTGALIVLNGECRLGNGVSMPRVDKEITFPNWRQVIPQATDKPAFVVALNAELLASLQSAMGSEFVKLTFTDEMSPIIVEPSGQGSGYEGDRHAKGILMPARIK